MAPPDSDQDASSQGDTPEMSLTTSESEASQINQTASLTTFHGYMRLPFELRAQIRTAAIKSAYPNPNPWKWPDLEKPCSRLATVSKEWQDDVERAVFGQVRIDPCDEGDVAKFKEFFTDERKKFLTRLDIAIDDDKETSPWHEEMGLLRISQVMEKVGQLFHYINGWDFCREGEKQQCIEVVFTTPHQAPGHHDGKYEQPHMAISSLWEQEDLSLLTHRGLIPTDIALWAIKSEFPSSLNMVTHLTFLPDCVPFPAAQKIIQIMPNLETCVLEVGFSSESEEGWRNLKNFIHQLQISTPSLRKLRLHSQDWISRPFVPPSMEKFAAALMDCSQSLEVLLTESFDLHPAFFLPFLEGAGATIATSNWRWPRLKRIDLRCFSDTSGWDSAQLKLSPADILIAAGRAAMAMPVLQIAQIEAERGVYFYIERELSNGAGGMGKPRMCLAGLEKSEEPRIVAAWTHFLRAEVTLVEENLSESLPTLRVYKPLTKG